MYQVLIVDDDQEMRTYLKSIVCDVLSELEVHEASTLKEAKKHAEDYKLDLILLDMEIDDQTNGLCVYNEIKELIPDASIFVITSHHHYFKEVMTIEPFCYLIKPLNVMFFKRKLMEFSILSSMELDTKCLEFKYNNEMKYIPLKHIFFFEKQKKKVRIVTKHGEYLIVDTLKNLQKQLDDRFYPIHQAYIANTKEIDRIEKGENRSKMLYFHHTNEVAIISRYRYDSFVKYLDEVMIQ